MPRWRVLAPDPPVVGFGARFPGDPNPRVTGKTLWGAAVGGNSDPAKHETGGRILALRRTYFGTHNDGTSMVSMIAGDHAAGRLPWVSTHFEDYTDLAGIQAGDYDSHFDGIIADAEAAAAPVWLTMSHEPENDHGGSGASADVAWENSAGPGYRAAQARFRARMDAWESTNGPLQNLSLHGSLMYYTFNPGSTRNPDAWYPGDGVWDTLGMDHYTEVDQEIDRATVFPHFIAYAEACNGGAGIPWTYPEWGLRGEDPNGPAKMVGHFDDTLTEGRDCVGRAYFDSSLNSTGSGWEIDAENGLDDAFRAVQDDPRSVTLAQMGY